MQNPLLNNMHGLNFNDTSNIQHYTHTPAVQQVQKSVNMYQGQTNMVSWTNSYGTPRAINSTNFQNGVSSIYSSAGYVITSQNMLANEKIGYANSSRQASYSQTSCATDLYNIQQGRDESVFNYLERFKEIKNQCFNLPFSDSDLAYLAFRGLKSPLRDWLRNTKFNSLDEVLVKAMAYELRIKGQNEKIGYANSSYHASCSQSSYATQHDTGVEVAPTFASSLANANNHDLTANVHHNYGQINVNSASMYLDEVRKEDLPEEMRQELDQMLAQFQCDFLYQVAISKKNKSDSDLSNSSVIMTTEPNGVHSESIASKESSLAVKEHINQKEIAMLDFLKPELSYT
jgi:hypothetical protein